MVAPGALPFSQHHLLKQCEILGKIKFCKQEGVKVLDPKEKFKRENSSFLDVGIHKVLDPKEKLRRGEKNSIFIQCYTTFLPTAKLSLWTVDYNLICHSAQATAYVSTCTAPQPNLLERPIQTKVWHLVQKTCS